MSPIISLLLSGLWIVAYIQSPFLLLIFYGRLKSIRTLEVLSGPKFVLPGIGAVVLLLYFAGLPDAGLSEHVPLGYAHFLISGLLLGGFYGVALWFRYTTLESVVLAILSVLAVDELWQTPYNVLNWTSGLQAAEVGLATGGWSLMSIPIFLYFLAKFKPGLIADRLSIAALGLAGSLTCAMLLFPWWSYWLTLPWALCIGSSISAGRYTALIPRNARAINAV